MANLGDNPASLVDLKVNNVVHFAEINPESNKVAYSTVEWRDAPPGWQANNDLFIIAISDSAGLGEPEQIIEANSGGVYGWWGTDYAWSPDSAGFLYSRPDGLGIISLSDGSVKPIWNILPYQTGGNWAWIPGTSWSPDGKTIYSVNHRVNETGENREPGFEQFDLLAIPLSGGIPVTLYENVGMFALPTPSPIEQKVNFLSTNNSVPLNQYGFLIAYIKAAFPNQSDSSDYILHSMDRDGSNLRVIFPDDGTTGLEPQQLVWSPERMDSEENFAIAFIYHGNIWMVDTISNNAIQITGDGLTSKIDWR
jgi:hypothetical protein